MSTAHEDLLWEVTAERQLRDLARFALRRELEVRGFDADAATRAAERGLGELDFSNGVLEFRSVDGSITRGPAALSAVATALRHGKRLPSDTVARRDPEEETADDGSGLSVHARKALEQVRKREEGKRAAEEIVRKSPTHPGRDWSLF
jgi:hypothetical protein